MNFLKFKLKVKVFSQILLRPKGRYSFLNKIPKNSKILDVGCGNNSAFKTKVLLPNSYYVGIDIQDYANKLDSNIYADKYVLTDPKNFTKEIISINEKFDAVISSHNLEHCDDRYGTLDAMLDKLNKKGKIYLSFPSEKSLNFPKRLGCLNYYDDPTHKDLPPDFNLILELMKKKSLKIIFCDSSYKPFFLNLIGNITEIFSAYTKKITYGVWEKWGFESIIIAEKNN